MDCSDPLEVGFSTREKQIIVRVPRLVGPVQPAVLVDGRCVRYVYNRTIDRPHAVVLTDRIKIEDDVEEKNQIHAAMKQMMDDPETREHAKALADKLSPLTSRNGGNN